MFASIPATSEGKESSARRNEKTTDRRTKSSVIRRWLIMDDLVGKISGWVITKNRLMRNRSGRVRAPLSFSEKRKEKKILATWKKWLKREREKRKEEIYISAMISMIELTVPIRWSVVGYPRPGLMRAAPIATIPSSRSLPRSIIQWSRDLVLLPPPLCRRTCQLRLGH